MIFWAFLASFIWKTGYGILKLIYSQSISEVSQSFEKICLVSSNHSPDPIDVFLHLGEQGSLEDFAGRSPLRDPSVPSSLKSLFPCWICFGRKDSLSTEVRKRKKKIITLAPKPTLFSHALSFTILNLLFLPEYKKMQALTSWITVKCWPALINCLTLPWPCRTRLVILVYIYYPDNTGQFTAGPHNYNCSCHLRQIFNSNLMKELLGRTETVIMLVLPL